MIGWEHREREREPLQVAVGDQSAIELTACPPPEVGLAPPAQYLNMEGVCDVIGLTVWPP